MFTTETFTTQLNARQTTKRAEEGIADKNRYQPPLDADLGSRGGGLGVSHYPLLVRNSKRLGLLDKERYPICPNYTLTRRKCSYTGCQIFCWIQERKRRPRRAELGKQRRDWVPELQFNISTRKVMKWVQTSHLFLTILYLSLRITKKLYLIVNSC